MTTPFMKKLAIASAILVAFSTAHAEMVLKRGNGTEPQSIDPQLGEGVPGSHIQRDLFEGLMTDNVKAETVAGVAESWDVSEDGKTYTFHLRKDAKWSDGEPVTAEDFVYAWQRAVDPSVGSKYSFVLFPIKNAEKINSGEIKDVNELGAKVIDPYTVQVELENPTPYFLGLMAFTVAYPVPKHVVEKYGREWTRPEHIVTNGPFKMSDWQPNSHLTVVKSDTYWDKDSVKLDKVIFYPIDDQNAELQRYRSGELDITYEIPNDQFTWIKGNFGDELRVAPYLGTYYYGLNTTKPPFKDNADLRRAINLAINRDIIVDKVTGLGETPAYSFVPPGIENYNGYVPEYAKLTQAEREALAKEYYAKAGYSKENPLKIDILYNTSENHKKVAVAVAAMLKQTLGVDATLTNQEWKVYLATRRAKEDTQVFRAGWIGDYNDPNTFLEMNLTNSGLNDSGYSSAEYDALVAKAATEKDPAVRAQELAAAEKIFIEDTAVVPIYHYVTRHLVKPYVRGFESNIMDRYPSKFISIEK